MTDPSLITNIDECINAARRQIALLEAARAVLVRQPTELATRKSRKPRVASVEDVMALVKDGVDSPVEISHRLNAHGRSTRARLRELEQKGLITHTSSGRWRPRRVA